MNGISVKNAIWRELLRTKNAFYSFFNTEKFYERET
jgi:hypothetical protein